MSHNMSYNMWVIQCFEMTYNWKRFKGTFQPDLLASIVYLYPELVIEKESFCCTVELDGKYTRSMMIVDRLKRIEFKQI